MEARERLIVIGNGMAGMATVEHLLTLRKDLEIGVFGAEGHVNYNRILLSSVLAGEARMEDIIMNPLEWYQQQGIDLHLGVHVKEVDLAAKRVITENGKIYGFDKLLLATGSNPFIPPIQGIQKEIQNGKDPGGIGRQGFSQWKDGIFTFRNMDDTSQMMAWARKSRKAIVIGGGLLGLEAARGLIQQGMDVTVVHLMNRLMEVQLDAAASEILQKEIAKLGIQILLEHSAEEILGTDAVEGIRFTNGRAHEADMVVIATGIRPNVQLAKEAGLAVNRGIVVSDFLQTSHPDVYAVGECVEHRGKVYGIVAPLMEQAQVAAAAMAGDRSSPYEGSMVATKLKVAGIALGSMGNIQGGIGCEELVYSDPSIALYKKVVIQGGHLVGAILLGDLEAYHPLWELMKSQVDITLQRKTLLTGGTPPMLSVAALSDEATICGCMGVSKGTIVKAIEECGLTSKQEISEKTKACTSCKGCAPLLDQILQEVLGGEYIRQETPAPFCGCFLLSYPDLRQEVMTRGLKSVRRILRDLGNGDGCATCKPGLQYMLSELWIKDYEPERSSRFVNDRFHANIQKDGTFSVIPRIYGGVTTPDQLRRIADVAEKYQVPMVKITGGQRIDLLGIPGDQLPAVWADLGMASGHAYTKAMRTCKTCVGDTFCRFGVQDAVTMGIELEHHYQGIPFPGKLKMAVSGCPRNCAESGIKDIGVVGIQTGWEIYVGGNGGIKIRVAELLAVVKTREEVLDLSGVFMQYYRENARWQERTSHFVERVGIEHLREVVVQDTLGIVDRLRQRMEQVVAAYEDPWTASQKSEERRFFEAEAVGPAMGVALGLTEEIKNGGVL